MMVEKGFALWRIYVSFNCPRHMGFGLANASVASGQRDPSTVHNRFSMQILHHTFSTYHELMIMSLLSNAANSTSPFMKDMKWFYLFF